MQRARLAEVQLMDCQVRRAVTSVRCMSLIFALFLCRDLRAWMESSADLDALLEVDSYRQVLIAQIKRIDEDFFE